MFFNNRQKNVYEIWKALYHPQSKIVLNLTEKIEDFLEKKNVRDSTNANHLQGSWLEIWQVNYTFRKPPTLEQQIIHEVKKDVKQHGFDALLIMFWWFYFPQRPRYGWQPL